MLHANNPIIKFIHNLRELKELPDDKSTSLPRCPIDEEPCIHYDGPLCNHFNCDAISMRNRL